MIGVEEASACRAVEGIGSCRTRSAAKVADAPGSHLPDLNNYEEFLNRNAVSIVGESELRYGRGEVLIEKGEDSPIGAESNREALMIGDLISALESKFKFGRKL